MQREGVCLHPSFMYDLYLVKLTNFRLRQENGVHQITWNSWAKNVLIIRKMNDPTVVELKAVVYFLLKVSCFVK